jgi:hypothetical protein
MINIGSYNQLDDLLDRVCERLQINPSQQKQAEERYKSVGEWLSANDSGLAIASPIIYPQGSLRIGTTVKPLNDQDYDLDIVCELSLDWRRCDPLKILDAIESRLSQNRNYLPLIERKNRCIRLNYANEFHLDILPACPDSQKNHGCVKVPDRKVHEWKDSNPRGFAEWFEDRSEKFKPFLAKIVEPIPELEPPERKSPLKRMVQLIKRYRDISFKDEPELAPISIILTTLAGSYYNGQTSINESLLFVLNEIMKNIRNGYRRIVVLNPTNKNEDFSDKWDDNLNLYKSFTNWIVNFKTLWLKVNNTSGIHNIARILKEMFGENIINIALKEQTEFIENLRKRNKLGVIPITGSLSTDPSLSGIMVPKNTFYGK